MRTTTERAPGAKRMLGAAAMLAATVGLAFAPPGYADGPVGVGGGGTDGGGTGGGAGETVQTMLMELIDPVLTLDPTSLTILVPPASGVATVTGGGFEYFPDAAEVDSFEFAAQITGGLAVTGTVAVDPLAGRFSIGYISEVGAPDTGGGGYLLLCSGTINGDGVAGGDGLSLTVGVASEEGATFEGVAGQSLGMLAVGGFGDRDAAAAAYLVAKQASPDRIGAGYIPPRMPLEQAGADVGDMIGGCLVAGTTAGWIGGLVSGPFAIVTALAGCVAGAAYVYTQDPDPNSPNPGTVIRCGVTAGVAVGGGAVACYALGTTLLGGEVALGGIYGGGRAAADAARDGAARDAAAREFISLADPNGRFPRGDHWPPR